MPVTFPTRDHQPELPADWDDTEIAGIIEGAVDLHVHPFPSPFPRRMGIVEATQDTAAAKYRAIVVKSHHHSMVPDVLALNEAGLGDIPVQVFGGVALNPQVGGLNPYAVDLALNLGGKIVWFPTISSHAHLQCEEDGTIGSFPNATITLRHAHPISVLGEDGKLKPEVYDILEQIKDHDAILTGGHLPAAEIEVLFDAALSIGVERILVNHPNFVIGATPEQAGEWARRGIYVEHSVGMYDTFFGARKSAMDIEILLQYIKHAGVGKTLLVSDTGQQNNPRPVDVIKVAIRNLLAQGVKEADIQRMVGGNAGDLLLGCRGLVETTFGYIHYRSAGSGPAVLVFSINQQSSAMQLELMEAMSPSVRVVAMDYPSHGMSDHIFTQPSVADYASCAIQLGDALGIDQFTVLGEATGSAVAAEVSRSNPDRVTACVLVNCPYVPPGVERNPDVDVRPAVRPADETGFPLARSIDFLLGRDPLHAPMEPTQEWMDRLNRAQIECGRERWQAITALHGYPMAEGLAGIPCPVLFLTGEHFYFGQYSHESLSLVSNGRLKIVKGGRFCMCWEKSQAVASDALAFMAESATTIK